jgi:hypothetical protein
VPLPVLRSRVSRKGISGVIAALQTDLLAIGYSVNVTGEFDEHTREVVDRFKRHFFTGSRSAFASGDEPQLGSVDSLRLITMDRSDLGDHVRRNVH